MISGGIATRIGYVVSALVVAVAVATATAAVSAAEAPPPGGQAAVVDAAWACDGGVTVTSEHRALSNIIIHHDDGETKVELDDEVYEHSFDAADYPGLWAVDIKAGNNGQRYRGERVLLDAPDDCEPEVGVGVLQFKLTWDTEADLDLWVREPNGATIYYEEPGPTDSGGFLDRDDNFPCGSGTDFAGGIENVFWDHGTTPPSGDYVVEVRKGALCLDVPNQNPTTYTLEVYVEGVLQEALTRTGTTNPTLWFVGPPVIDTLTYTHP